MEKLKSYFVSGIVVLAPLFLTVIFLVYLIRVTDRLIVNPLFELLPVSQLDRMPLEIMTKLCIGLLVFFILSLIGFLAQKFLFRRLFEAGDTVLHSIPVFNRIYDSIKEIAQAFFGDKSGIFKRAVFVEYPRKGVWALGFVTQEKQWMLGQVVGKELVSVYLPHPPNPATGYFIFAPKDEILEIGVTVEEGIRMVISAGAAIPGQKK